MFVTLLFALLGCDEPSSPPQPSLDVSTIAPVQQACAMEHCASAPDVNACVESQCAITEPQWAVEPTGIRYSRADGILHVDVAVEHQAGRVGTQEMTHEAEAWLGVTVLKGDGSDLDLAVQTVIPDQIGDSFVFAAEVGDDVEDIIFGLWGTKIEPCDVDRSGCRNFGFVLDTSLAASPPDTYGTAPKTAAHSGAGAHGADQGPWLSMPRWSQPQALQTAPAAAERFDSRRRHDVGLHRSSGSGGGGDSPPST